MNQLSKQTGCALLAAAGLLAGCGGGGGDDGGSPPPDGGSQIPASALQSPEALAAFQKTLNNSGTDSTSSPLIVGNTSLPKSDTTEPVPVK